MFPLFDSFPGDEDDLNEFTGARGLYKNFESTVLTSEDKAGPLVDVE